MKTATKGEKLACRAEGISTADLDFDNCKESLTGSLRFLCSSGMILLYSNHLEGRQTVENHLVYTGTSSYRCTHIMTSSISILVHFFFAFFIFAEADLHPVKISCYTVYYDLLTLYSRCC